MNQKNTFDEWMQLIRELKADNNLTTQEAIIKATQLLYIEN